MAVAGKAAAGGDAAAAADGYDRKVEGTEWDEWERERFVNDEGLCAVIRKTMSI